VLDLFDSPTSPPAQLEKGTCIKELVGLKRDLFQLQNLFYASSSRSLLIILQGIDASGKDGVIRHVFSGMNPQGIGVKSFKEPTEEELKHDFLWRIYPHFPALGIIKVFNRSYYEDVLPLNMDPRTIKETLNQRCSLINILETHLSQNKTTVLKFFLHISKDEQAKRIKERLTDRHKQWKYNKHDLKSLAAYDNYLGDYNEIMKETNQHAWHIVPSDKKWYRNYYVANIVKETLEQFKLEYPALNQSI
jgi:PPK2 family polyphosphate:nucleotide phosphotransferase